MNNEDFFPKIGDIVFCRISRVSEVAAPVLVKHLYDDECACLTVAPERSYTILDDVVAFVEHLTELTDEHRALFEKEIALLEAASVFVEKDDTDDEP